MAVIHQMMLAARTLQKGLSYGLRYNEETERYTLLGSNNRTKIQSLMRRCVLAADGTVNYYLDPNNSALKIDGTPANLTGADGNVMVQIPKFYERRWKEGSVHTWVISLYEEEGLKLHEAFLRNGGEEVPFAYYRAYPPCIIDGKLMSVSGVNPTASTTMSDFRAAAQANGPGWSLGHHHILDAIRLLFITEYGNMNSQAVLGSGNSTSGIFAPPTGRSNGIGNGSSGPSNSEWVSYRGIEDIYGGCREKIDGILIRSGKYYICNDEREFADTIVEDFYVEQDIPAISTMSGALKEVSPNFLPQAASGTDYSRYYADYIYVSDSSSTGALHFGGGAASGESCGIFSGAWSTSPSSVDPQYGAGLSYR